VRLRPPSLATPPAPVRPDPSSHNLILGGPARAAVQRLLLKNDL